MSAQGSLFDAVKPVRVTNARRTDPDTSHVAAVSNRGQRDVDRRAALKAHYENRDRGLTDFELETITGVKQTSIGVRRGELIRKFSPPLVEDSGSRKPAPSGSPAIVWRITQAGIDFYEAERAKG